MTRQIDPLTVIVAGMVAGDPNQGGATWAVLQYVLGLQRLGHRVLLVEPLSRDKLRPFGAPLERSHNWSYFLEVLRQFGLEGCAALLLGGTRQAVGLSYPELAARCRRADVLINIGGMLQDADILTIASNIATSFAEATPEKLHVLIATGLALFALTFLVNFTARWIVGRSEKRFAA